MPYPHEIIARQRKPRDRDKKYPPVPAMKDRGVFANLRDELQRAAEGDDPRRQSVRHVGEVSDRVARDIRRASDRGETVPGFEVPRKRRRAVEGGDVVEERPLAGEHYQEPEDARRTQDAAGD